MNGPEDEESGKGPVQESSPEEAQAIEQYRADLRRFEEQGRCLREFLSNLPEGAGVLEDPTYRAEFCRQIMAAMGPDSAAVALFGRPGLAWGWTAEAAAEFNARPLTPDHGEQSPGVSGDHGLIKERAQ